MLFVLFITPTLNTFLSDLVLCLLYIHWFHVLSIWPVSGIDLIQSSQVGETLPSGPTSAATTPRAAAAMVAVWITAVSLQTRLHVI